MRTDSLGTVGAPRSAREMILELQDTVRRSPGDAHCLMRLAELEAKVGNAIVACETYARAGDTYEAQGFAPRALAAFTQALGITYSRALLNRVPRIARALGKLYAKEGLVCDALSTLDVAAGVLIDRGLDEPAASVLVDRIEIEDSEVARIRLAEAYFRLGLTSMAADELVIVFRRLLTQGRRDEAIEVAERLLGARRDAGIARACAELYLQRNRRGDPFLALAKLRICCDVDPRHPPTLQLLARAFELAGHPTKAARVQRELLRAVSKQALSPAPASSRCPADPPEDPPKLRQRFLPAPRVALAGVAAALPGYADPCPS